MQSYVQGDIRKKQLIASFVEYFQENLENIISVYFQFYNPKLSQESCLYSLYYAGLFSTLIYDTKDPADCFFHRAL